MGLAHIDTPMTSNGTGIGLCWQEKFSNWWKQTS